jgi:hypothetical protein
MLHNEYIFTSVELMVMQWLCKTRYKFTLNILFAKKATDEKMVQVSFWILSKYTKLKKLLRNKNKSVFEA